MGRWPPLKSPHRLHRLCRLCRLCRGSPQGRSSSKDHFRLAILRQHVAVGAARRQSSLSASFCRLRTFFRSPALLAVKIRCRSHRTSSPACRQSTAPQSRTSSSGPFTMMVSNLPIGSGVSVHQVVTGSPDPRQLPNEPGTKTCMRPVMRRPSGGGASPAAPVSCCLSANGLRFLGHPAPAGELNLPCGRPTGRTRPYFALARRPHRGHMAFQASAPSALSPDPWRVISGGRR